MLIKGFHIKDISQSEVGKELADEKLFDLNTQTQICPT